MIFPRVSDFPQIKPPRRKTHYRKYYSNTVPVLQETQSNFDVLAVFIKKKPWLFSNFLPK
jgi:hypothetical protein